MRDEITRLRLNRSRELDEAKRKEITKILNDAKLTIKHLEADKKAGEGSKQMTIDGLIKYCETVKKLCNEILSSKE
jgi:hypothetical protein